MSESVPQTTEAVIATINDGLHQVLVFLDQYSKDQMLLPKDHVGWNVRDHLTHLATWADGIAALVRREDRWAAMGVEEETAQGHDFDQMNDEIVVQQRHLSPAEARAWVVAANERVVAAVAALKDEELQRPYDYFVAPFTGNKGRPIVHYILENSAGHYKEHMPWISEIVAG